MLCFAVSQYHNLKIKWGALGGGILLLDTGRREQCIQVHGTETQKRGGPHQPLDVQDDRTNEESSQGQVPLLR